MPWYFWVIVAAILGLWAVAVVELGVWKEWHHEYIGLAMAFLPWPWLAWVGLVVMVDDAWQHGVQLTHPTYRSPLHQLYEWVWSRIYG